MQIPGKPRDDCGTDRDSSANEAASADHSLTISEGPALGVREMARDTFLRLAQKGRAQYTYFMRATVSGEIKIGRSIDPDARAEYLSWQECEPIEILATLRGGNLERAYHNHFGAHRLHGEWFSPHPDILAEITRLQQREQPHDVD